MGKRGPPKTPTELKLLRGVPGGEHKLVSNEPKPDRVENVEPPDWLSNDAKEVWLRESERLAKLGLLTEIDLSSFGRYCDVYVRWKQARDFIDAQGFCYAIYHEQNADEIKRGDKKRLKYMAQWPQVSIYHQLGKELTRLEQCFGMNPSARASLSIPLQPGHPGGVKNKLYG